MKLNLKTSAFLPLFLILPTIIFAQSGVNTNGSSTAAPTTAVPFLNITPDSRSGALGDAGVALSPDVNANYWNPAKLAFLEDKDAVSISYSPWLRQLVPDISLSYLSYAHTLNDRDAIGVSLRYFNYGSIPFYDSGSNYQGTYYPNEYSINASFARKFGDGFSLGLTAGYIHSNFSNASFASGTGQSAQTGSNAVAAGVSLYYKKQFQEFGKDASFSFGTNISNLGTKISYANDGNKYFLPANLKIGIANTLNLDDYNQLTFAFDINKLLVPNSTNTDNVSVVSGIFNSFSDGGNEFQQLTFSPALEYWYNKVFALRAGYFYEDPSYGGSRYLTFGAGFRYDVFKFDFSYLAATQQNSPLANTLRFTLSMDLGSRKK